MLRDIRYFFYQGDGCAKIINDISNNKYNSLLRTQIAIYEIHGGGFGVLSSSDEVDEIVLENGGINKPDAAVDNIRLSENAYPFKFGNRELRTMLQYLIPVSPRPCNIIGLSGENYPFHAFNITDEIRDSAQGVYLFTVITDGMNTEQPRHITIQIASVNENNVEAINEGKKLGAKYFMYYYEETENKRQAIIKDIKQSPDFVFQKQNYPDIVRWGE